MRLVESGVESEGTSAAFSTMETANTIAAGKCEAL